MDRKDEIFVLQLRLQMTASRGYAASQARDLKKAVEMMQESNAIVKRLAELEPNKPLSNFPSWEEMAAEGDRLIKESGGSVQ